MDHFIAVDRMPDLRMELYAVHFTLGIGKSGPKPSIREPHRLIRGAVSEK